MAMVTMTRRAFGALLIAAYSLASISSVSAHGWIQEPPSRNLMAQGEDGFYQQVHLSLTTCFQPALHFNLIDLRLHDACRFGADVVRW